MGDIVGGITGGIESALGRDWSKRDAAEQRQAAERASQQDMAFQERMSNTAYQRATKDMEAAGLNPMLAYQHGGASTPGGSAVAPAMARASPVDVIGGYTSAAQVRNIDANIELAKANTEKTAAEQKEIEARTPTYAVSMDATRQQIKQSIATVDNLIQQTRTGAASAAHLDQQVRNLQEAIPQIRATVDNLKALTKLAGATAIMHGEQANLAGAQAGAARAQTQLTDAERAKVNQLVTPNLPAIERALKDLELKHEQLKLPKAGMDAAVHNSWLGALSAMMRALNPLAGLIAIAK